MTTSDSEAFESADEDILEENVKKSSNVKITDPKSKVTDSSVNPVSKKDERNDSTPKNRTESTDDDYSEVKNKGEKKKNKPQRQPAERKPKQSMKLGVKVAEPEKVAQKLSKPVQRDKNDEVEVQTSRESGCSDNEWNDFDTESKSKSKTPEKSTDDGAIKSSTQSIKAETKKEDADGWDDGFEDWGEDTEEIKSHISNSYSAQNTATEFNSLADRLSALGDKDTALQEPSAGGWGAWGGWGASLLSSGVSQLTSHVSQGFNTVSNVIESGMGAPDPEELVRIQKASREKLEKEQQTKDPSKLMSESAVEDSGVFQFGKLVSSVTKLVETTGTAVVSGGLDTLEEIGKRTMRVIQGDEPGGRVKLSTLLREARDYADEMPPKSDDGDKKVLKKAPKFEALFDDFQGLVHLEALEMLSKQCDVKIQSLLNNTQGKELVELKETLAQVKDICELPDPDDEEDDSDGKLDVETLKCKLQEATKELGVPLTFETILKCWEEILAETNEPLQPDEDSSEGEGNLVDTAEGIYHSAVSNLARCSALCVQLLHKSTALLSVRVRRSTADEADGITQLTAVLSSHVGEVAAVYSQKLHKIAQKCEHQEKVNEFITNIFLEARKGSSYLQDAFYLTIPILQIGAT